MTLLGITLTILIGLVTAALYTLFLHRRVERFSTYLSESRSKRGDQQIQKAMIDEVRGAGRTKRFGFLLLTLLVPIVLLSMQFVVMPVSVVEDFVLATKQAEAAVQQLKPSSNETPKEAEKSAEDKIAEAENVHQLARSARNGSFVLMAIYLLVFLAYWVVIFRMITQVIVGTIFGGIINEFTSRIHQLATKEEIAELWRAELKVSDEESLFCYFDVAAKIAKRHKVEDAVGFIEAWKESKLHFDSTE